uniref:carcinoembryonic antigen-related cell adhesion molecule 19-like n=1 Tax=Euleptes europaea TaxID=460621 RepID=UPI00253F8C9C|nr:carcinoembryonic antigen-related cell adhesion molecule 19-like [Euleptes europaea]
MAPDCPALPLGAGGVEGGERGEPSGIPCNWTKEQTGLRDGAPCWPVDKKLVQRTKVHLDLTRTRTMRGFRSQDIFDTGYLLAAVLLCFCLLPTQAADSLPLVAIPENPAEGQNVTLSVENVTGSIRQFEWYRGLVTDGGSRIFTYFTGENKRPQRNGVRFTNREFGYPNGSLLIRGVQQNDSGPYSVVVLVRPKGTFKGSTVLQLAGSATDAPPTTPPLTTLPAKVPSMLGWIVAGVLVGILLAGALGAILVYRFVLQKAEPGTGVAMKLDPRGKKPPASKRDDKEPIYEVMDSPVESPQMEGKSPPPIPGPFPPLAGSCPSLDSNYMDLLRRAESIYSEIKR